MMAKSKQTDDSIATAAGGAPKARALPPTVINCEVARRAYDLYIGRGSEHGHDVEDWLQAE
jgi:DUF2934 family protein